MEYISRSLVQLVTVLSFSGFGFAAAAASTSDVCAFLKLKGLAAPSYCGDASSAPATPPNVVEGQPSVEPPSSGTVHETHPPVMPVVDVPQTLTSTDATTLGYGTVVNIGDYKGSTFFTLMERTVKPALDKYAEEGFEVVDGATVEKRLPLVDKKVSTRALKGAGGLENLKMIANELHQGSKVTFYDLPQKIKAIAGSVDIFNLSTFFALVSGGGVAVKIDSQNFSYNVNYGTGKTQKDEMTGRSFGEAPGRMALDASDSHYLKTLEAYVRSAGDNTDVFMKSLLEILTNNDPSNFSKIKADGQAVASDFVAVYVAEQDRHLMANLQSHHWDQALLEVTLLAAFHAGQEKVMVMYNGHLTEKTHEQVSGCSAEAAVEKAAGMVDYWQFSNSTDPENCNRSGINITKKDFRLLGGLISNYERAVHPDLVQNVQRHFKNIQKTGNLFADLSGFLINYSTPKKLDPKTLELADDFAKFLAQVRKDAPMITQDILSTK